jgi:hypothetical protein
MIATADDANIAVGQAGESNLHTLGEPPARDRRQKVTSRARNPLPVVEPAHLPHETVRRLPVKGGVLLFRGSGVAARRYLEADRSRADDYYLEAGTALASFTEAEATGAVIAEARLSPDEYAA